MGDVVQIRHAAVVASLRDLVPPDMAREAIEKAACLVDAHPEHRGVFLVCGATYGPRLTSRQNVAGIVSRSREACVVIDLDLLGPAPLRAVGRTGGWR